jgi:multicomponent Na+:H+ antiporter subunit D
MSAATWLPVPVAIALASGVAAPILARLHARAALGVGVAAMSACAVVLGYIDVRVFTGSGRVVVQYFGGDRPEGGTLLGIAFAGDPFGLVVASVTAVLGALLLLSLLSEFGEAGKREVGGLAALVQILVAALLGAALTADLVNLFVWFEVAALCSYGLTGFFLERPTALEAAFKNLVLTSTAGFTVFVGAGMLYSADGALSFGQLHDVLPHPAGRVQLVALALLAGGFLTKAGLMPFHGWLPDAHPPVPGGVSALFSGLMVNLGVVALTRLALQVFPHGSAGHLLGLLTALGIVSAVAGAALALVQDDLKRVLAWDTISQIGIVVVGMATVAEKGVTGAVYHLANHALFKSMLFLCAGAIVHSTGKTRLSEMGGLARTRPFTTAAFTLGAIAIAGVPPVNGYPSLGLIHEGLQHEPVVFALAIVAQILTVAALGRACWLGFYRRRPDAYDSLEPTKTGMRVSLTVLGVACLAFGVFAQTLVSRVIGPASSILLHPDVYAAAVLHGGGRVPRSAATFDWGNPLGYLETGGEAVAGLAIMWLVVKRDAGRFVEWLRRIHTGSVNDYATYAIGGFVLAFAVLAG